MAANWVCLPLSHEGNSYNSFFVVVVLVAVSWAAPTAYGGSQAKGLIRAVAAILCQSQSNEESEPCLRPTPQLTSRQILNPLSEARD